MRVPLVVRVGDVHVTRLVDDLQLRKSVHGSAEASFNLNAPLSTDFDPFTKVHVFDGPDIVWEGRLEDPGRSTGPDGQQWDMSAIGEVARAADRAAARIYVDRDMSGFAKTAGSATSANADASTLPSDEDTDALVMQFNPGQPIDNTSVSAMAYKKLADTGQRLGGFAYSIIAGANTVNFEQQATVRTLGVVGSLATVRNTAFSTSNANIAPASAGSAFAVGANVLTLRIARVSGGATTVGSEIFWGGFSNVWVRGLLKDRLGADISGPSTYVNPYVLAHEVVTDLLGSMLTAYDGATAVIDTSSTYQIDQLAYPDGVTAEQVLADLMEMLPDYYWTVGPTDPATGKPSFAWRKWPTTVRYEASLRGGLSLPGADAERYNRVTVRWKDARGRVKISTYTAGATISGTPVPTVPELDAQGLVREPEVQDLSDELGSQAAADKFAAEFLLAHGTPPVSGTLTVTGKIYDADTGRMVAPWEIEPGYLVRVRELADHHDDLSDTGRDGKCVFRIVGMSYTASANSAELELDAPPRTDEVLLAEQISKRQRKR